MFFENVQVFNYYDAANSSSELTANFIKTAIEHDDVVIECNNQCVGHISNPHQEGNNILADVWLQNDFVYRTGAADFYIDQYEVLRSRNNEMVTLRIRYVAETSWYDRIRKFFSLNGVKPKT